MMGTSILAAEGRGVDMNLIAMFKPTTLANLQTPTERAAIDPVNVDLQQLLLDMQRYGKPRLHCHEDGKWSCVIDVSISPVGAKFEVRSDFDKPTPIAAAMQCNERLGAAIASLKGEA